MYRESCHETDTAFQSPYPQEWGRRLQTDVQGQFESYICARDSNMSAKNGVTFMRKPPNNCEWALWKYTIVRHNQWYKQGTCLKHPTSQKEFVHQFSAGQGSLFVKFCKWTTQASWFLSSLRSSCRTFLMLEASTYVTPTWATCFRTWCTFSCDLLNYGVTNGSRGVKTHTIWL